MERALDADLGTEVRVTALDELELLVEDIDNSKDFCSLPLLSLLLGLLQQNDISEDINFHVLWILGTMVQNNPVVKKKVSRIRFIFHCMDSSGIVYMIPIETQFEECNFIYESQL
jgi:hypothetical protein